jgi:hypothetical protein
MKTGVTPLGVIPGGADVAALNCTAGVPFEHQAMNPHLLWANCEVSNRIVSSFRSKASLAGIAAC